MRVYSILKAKIVIKNGFYKIYVTNLRKLPQKANFGRQAYFGMLFIFYFDTQMVVMINYF